MQGFVFWLVYPLLWLISILPFRLFYLFSDLVYILVYHIVGYRKKTVENNLKLAFPEKSETELKIIKKKFYHHMCDMFLEMIKTLTISEAELKKRFVFTHPEDIETVNNLGKGVLVMCGHYASYEWMISMEVYGLKLKGHGIYKRIRNKYFDKLVKDIRGKFNTEMIESHRVVSTVARHQKNYLNGIYGMIADQTPKRANYKFWTDFMGIKVPFFTGTEKLSKDFDMPVYYLEVEKVKRGFYEARLKKITNNPQSEPDFFITTSFRDRLEAQIKAHPEYYLWTHKRFKHRNAPIPENAVVK
ncbi:lysophospholipid acyltransferase family protein [Zunongwangia sp. SCSIO 43204]|uniref:lysophospholipid acyltransferase family protein n=1 Tax=Zunongwangia sp. SCSIO 43204 TaxID=2779359 RepID=UPI001CA98FAF|nr:lysophospholipid acyltransferase family protein [Zunongwangia sp. SCSIO 43204]UAB83815.1 lysophospholipid acyltransferase family protein [Zunongwangia sp. SCSIO 43204]